MFKNAKTFLPLVAILGVVACAPMEGRETVGQDLSDTAISTKVRADFVADNKVQATQVHVETMQGIVELSGFVDSKETEARAVHIARNVDGVKGVRDEIVVR